MVFMPYDMLSFGGLFGKLEHFKSRQVVHRRTCPQCGKKLTNLYKNGDRWLCRKCSTKAELNAVYGTKQSKERLYECDPNKAVPLS
jgi:ribosomal protein S27AE